MIQDISMTASAEASGRASARRNNKSTATGKIRLLDGAVKIDGKLHSLNPGVQIWKRRGVDKLVVRVFLANGSTQTKSYPITPEGVKQANEQAKLNSKEIASYGADFGALSVMERQAIEFYRQYEKECIGMGIQPCGVLNVLWKGIEWAKAATCGAPLFPEVMEEYLKYVESHSGEKHIIRQRGLAKHMCKYWKKKRINDFQESDVHAYLKTIKGRKGAKPASWTLAANFNLIRALFAYAAKHRIIKPDMNPTLAMDCIDTGTTAEPEVMTCEEVKRMLVWCAQSESWQDMLPAIVLGVFCGVRNAERCRMRWSDFRPGGRDEIYLSRLITKTNNARVIPISPALSAWLDYFTKLGFPIGSDKFIIKTEVDTEKCREDRQGAFIRSARKAGIEIPKNGLRHTAASNLSVTLGKSAAADILGHSERMLIRHYRRAMTVADAEDLLSITPQSLGLC